MNLLDSPNKLIIVIFKGYEVPSLFASQRISISMGKGFKSLHIRKKLKVKNNLNRRAIGIYDTQTHHGYSRDTHEYERNTDFTHKNQIGSNGYDMTQLCYPFCNIWNPKRIVHEVKLQI